MLQLTQDNGKAEGKRKWSKIRRICWQLFLLLKVVLIETLRKSTHFFWDVLKFLHNFWQIWESSFCLERHIIHTVVANKVLQGSPRKLSMWNLLLFFINTTYCLWFSAMAPTFLITIDSNFCAGDFRVTMMYDHIF